MLKKSVLICAALSILMGSAAAQTSCAPEKLSASVDQFANDPYGARAWRVLHGLGDPKIERASSDFGNWQAVDAWKKRMAELAPDLPGVQDAGYDCRMAYPLEVLNKRVGGLGKTSPYIKQWIQAQGVVIAACSGKENAVLDLPAALADQPPAIAALQSDDRDYHNASVAFYKDKPKALELFRKISASGSSHKAYARYNVANLLANGKDVIGARTEAKAILADQSLSSVHGITQELLGYIANIEDTPAGWTALIDSTLDVLSKPESEIMASEKLKSDYARALNDISYTGVTAKQDDWWIKGELPENPTLSKAIVDVAHKSPMALWMMTGQSVDTNYKLASWAMVGDKWNGWSASYIDRAMVLTGGVTGLSKDVLDVLKSTPDDASRAAAWTKVKSAMDVTAKTCGEAPETAAVGQLLLHAVRLSALAGKFEEAYSGLDAVPFKGAAAYRNGVVNKLAQYILATGNAEEGRRFRDSVLTLGFFAAVPADQQTLLKAQYSNFLGWVAEDETKWKDALAMNNSKLANPLMNLLPTATLSSLVGEAQFSASQKALLSRAAWTRNYARGKKNSTAETDAMMAANPQIKTAYENVGKEFPRLNDKHRLLLTILRNPRFGILLNSDDYTDPIEADRKDFAAVDELDHNDKNWWCPLEPGRQLHALRANYDAASGTDVVLDYHKRELTSAFDQALADKMSAARETLLKQHPMIKALNTTEISSLEKMGSAPSTLTKAAIAWGKASKGNDGAPEALGLAVRTTRYGCNWHGGHKAYSKPAQELLKTKFGKTEWAAKTPYWFDCMASTTDEMLGKAKTCKAQPWPKDELPR
jgi:hypothetical protein